MIATFSIIARDPATGQLGGAVQSKFLAVGSAVLWGQAGAGIVATQAHANLDIGELALPILAKGYPAEAVGQAMLALDPESAIRQFGIVDARGGSFSFTGRDCFDYAGGISRPNLAVQGNILVSRETIVAMAEAYDAANGPLAHRLMAALAAGQAAGGDKRGRQSAALLVLEAGGSYGGYNDRLIDLRVDDDPEPIERLQQLLAMHELLFHKSQPENQLELKPGLVQLIQDKLRRLGYYQGPVSGQYDKATRLALSDFCGWENLEEIMVDGQRIDQQVYQILMEKE